MVQGLAERPERQGRRNDAKEEDGVHDGAGAQGVPPAEVAHRKDAVRGQEHGEDVEWLARLLRPDHGPHPHLRPLTPGHGRPPRRRQPPSYKHIPSSAPCHIQPMST